MEFPPAPVNVRVIGPDETVYSVELAYVGLDGRGFHTWDATMAVPLVLGEGFRLRADEVPPRTSIRVVGAEPPG